jgi:hypothetical protein
MARTRQTARRMEKKLTTWTRFYLPREQEWPTWSVDHADVHVGPLAGKGCWEVSLGRMVENPEQAAYIIRKCYLRRKRIAYLYKTTTQNGPRWMT